jgi:predicted nucleic acid-binding protein
VIVVVDASVAIKWFLAFRPDEGDADKALELLQRAAAGRLKLHQPPHFLAEVAAVLAREKPADAHDDLLDLMAIEQSTDSSPDIYATALDLALRHGHPLFDTLYHAVALHTPGATLITADRRYYEKARNDGCIMLLGEWVPPVQDE